MESDSSIVVKKMHVIEEYRDSWILIRLNFFGYCFIWVWLVIPFICVSMNLATNNKIIKMIDMNHDAICVENSGISAS